MLPKWRSAFKVEEDDHEVTKYGSPIGAGGSISNKVVVGLKILVQINISEGKSNIVVKSTASSRLPDHYKATEYYCFLKSCHLCNKKLSFEKDVYMYMGDQGFCSIECRNKQIDLDDKKELEKSTKQMIASYRYRHCSNTSSSDRRETQNLIKELRRQRHKHMPQPQKIQWAIVS